MAKSELCCLYNQSNHAKNKNSKIIYIYIYILVIKTISIAAWTVIGKRDESFLLAVCLE